MNPSEIDRFEFHVSVREWNTLTDELVKPVAAAGPFPKLRAAHEWLCRYAIINKVQAPPPPAYFVLRLEQEWDEDLEVSEIGFDVSVPGLPSYLVHKIALLMTE